jgi:site-specific DNA recombinase
MNVVIYARFSSHSQNEQSIEGQMKTCHEFAQRNGYQVIDEYIDRALTGTNDNRPEFQKMIEDSHKKQFKGIIVYQLDRFARNRYDSAVYKAKLKKNGVRVYSARENISEDASGVLMEGILESMAEYYSTELSQKIKRGMELNAQKGLCTGGNIALGYKVDENKRFVIDELTSPTVLKVFEMYSSGHKISEIIDHLNSQGIMTSRGVQFNKNSISKMLRNKRYIGIYTFKGVEVSNSIPRIIEDDLFFEVQEKLTMNKKSPGRARAKNEYLLTTKLFCGKCNAMMTGISGTSMTGKKHQYYVCNNAKVKKCDKHSIKKEFIENEVIDQCRALLTDANIDLISREVVKLIDKEEKENSVLKSLNRQLNDNQKAMDNLLRAIENGQAVDLITERLQDKKFEREKLQRQDRT